MQHIIKHLFRVDTLEEVPRERLEALVEEYPSFGIARYLLSRKLRAEDAGHFSEETQKTNLYFTNPLWLQWLLQNTASSTSVTLRERPSRPAFGDQSPVVQAAELSAVTEIAPAEEKMPAIEETPVIEETVEHTEAPTDETGETWASTEEMPSTIEAVPEEQAPVIEETPEMEETPAIEAVSTEEEMPAEEMSPAVTAEETHVVPEEIPVVPDEIPVVEEAATDTEHLAATEEIMAIPETEAPVTEEVPVTEEAPITEEPPIAEEIPVEEKSPAVAAEEAQPVSQETPAVQPREEETAITSSIVSSALASVEPPLVFESYHTIDYFASQGIKLTLDENPSDKLGKQLKSFTEWLKVMRKLPQKHLETVVPDQDTENKIQSFAAHSIVGKEIVTETMAEVLAKQGMYEKAADMYRKLSLLNPGKRAYFATKIEQLKIE